MTDHDQPPPPPGAGPPPPGWPPPGEASEYAGRPGGPEAAGWAGPSGAGPGGPHGSPAYGIPLGRPLHKPGTVPLRPLTLSDIFDGAFTTIRRNPKATIGVAALVTVGFMLLPVLVTIVLGLTGQVAGFNGTDSTSPFQNAAVTVANLISGLFGFLAGIVVTGLIVPVVTRATIGEKITAGAAWQQAKGRLVRLLLLSLLEGLVAVVVLGVPITLAVLFGFAVGRDSGGGLVVAILLGIAIAIAAVCAMLAIHIKWFQLAAPVVVVERRGVFAALSRSGRLVKGQFWRILGIYLLTLLATTILNQFIGVPFAIVGAGLALGFPGAAGTVGLLLSSNIASVISGAIIGPFAGAVAVLQYLDQRFRKEGFDIELINHVQSRRQA